MKSFITAVFNYVVFPSGNVPQCERRPDPKQITTWIDPRTGKPAPNKDGGRSAGSMVFPTFESPPSPLSLMDVITVGSPVAVDRSGTHKPSCQLSYKTA